MRVIWLSSACVLLVLMAALVANLLRLPRAPSAPPAVTLDTVDADAAAQRLAGALRIPTVTVTEQDRVDWSQWPRLHDYLAVQFPGVHHALTRETVNGYSLLYTWPGTDPQAAPILLLAHQDVVPVEAGTEARWQYPAFGGVVADGFVWGRGALDDKSSLMAQLEAVEFLIEQGFRPSRTVYLAFGHDEEIGGQNGAAAIARELEARGVQAEFSLDEGGAVVVGVFAGFDRPVATVATAEKGYVSFRLTTRDGGGHSSRPPPVTAIGRLSRAIARLQEQQRPLQLRPPVDTMLETLAPELPFSRRLAMANLWLFRPVVAREMARQPLTAALVRTTTAPTMLQAGVKDNVLPTEAQAVVNFRILPGESIATVGAHIRQVVDDPGIALTSLEFASEPSPVSGIDTGAYRAIAQSIGEVFPQALVVPSLVIGATDSRHYSAVSRLRYNFLPVELTDTDVSRLHGLDERIAVEAHRRGIQFYIRLLQATAGALEPGLAKD